MATLPNTGDDLDLITLALDTQPSYTHKLDIDHSKVAGMTDERDALLQAVYLILNVERYAYPIYSRRYGVELVDLIGKPKEWAMSELKRRVDEALTQDDRSPARVTGPLTRARKPCGPVSPSTPSMVICR